MSARRTAGRSHLNASRLRWIAAASALFLGIVLWVVGVRWGGALAGLGLLGFVAAAWLDVGPQGGHVHDSGLSAYGVNDAAPVVPEDLS